MDADQLDSLVRAARSGGGWAFGRLWEELSPTVAGYLRARGVAPHDVDDVTSEVFLAAFRGMPDFEGDGERFRSWLFTIAHHRGVDVIRARGRALPSVEYDPDHDDRAEPSAETEALAHLSEEAMRAMLGELSADQRDVLLLRVVADLTVAQIAETLGRTEGAIKQLQRRAVRQLQERMAEGAEATPADSAAVPVPFSAAQTIAGSR